jgi:hypothetical protein
MELNAEHLEYLNELACFRANLSLDSLGICLEALEKKPDITENRRHCLNIFLALLDFSISLPFQIQGYKIFLIENLPELKESYSMYPIELKELTEKVITQIEKIIEC